MDTLDTIIGLEWAAFQQVRNVGGRAACQDDRPGFEIHRRSQLLAWNEATRESYLGDLIAAVGAGRNLLMEKYARMMAWTAPEEYHGLKPDLPDITEEAAALAAHIAATALDWQREFAAAYPKLASRGRPVGIHDAPGGVTSFEVYLRGELATYSPATLRALAAHVADLKARGRNMSLAAMEHTARLSGWGSLGEAEAKA